MTISPQWAEYAPSTSAPDNSSAVDPGAAPATYSTVWAHVSSPAESLDDETALDFDDTVAPSADREVADAYDGATAYAPDDAGDIGPSRVAEYTATPGIPSRGVCLLTLVAVGACAAVDLVLARGVTMFFDLCFVTICLVAAMSVRRRDLFTAGVLPPLVFGAVVGVIAVMSPHTFVSFGGASKAFMTGLAQHAAGLVAGYAVALVTVGSRVSASRVR